MWDDDWFYELDPSEKLVWVFLLTNPRANIAGIYKLNKRWASQATGLDYDVFNTILSRFVKEGKIIDQESWVGLVNFHKHLAYRNASVAQGIVRLYREGTGCPQAMDSLWLTLLNSTLLYLSDSDAKASQLKNEIKEIIMSFKNMRRYKGEDGGYEEKAIDLDSGEPIVDKEEESRAKERALMEWGEKIRGKKFLDRPTQLSFIKRLKGADISPATIKQTYLELLQSEYWQEQLRTTGQLPDFKTIFSNLKNKHERSDD